MTQNGSLVYAARPSSVSADMYRSPSIENPPSFSSLRSSPSLICPKLTFTFTFTTADPLSSRPSRA